MNNVAIYLRKSREDEELKDETLSRHETMLLEYCRRNRLAVEKIYKEVVSGEKISNRPEMQKLLEDVSAGMYKGVVCVEIERLSRGNPIDQCEILDTFKSSGTKIYTLNKIYDLSKEEIDEEYFEFALFMSRREYKTITRRMQRGRLQATKDGYFAGAILPYGYRKERMQGGNVLVPDETEAPIVKMIFNLFLGGMGTWKIAKHLNSKGIKTRHGKTWNDWTVLNVITNKNHIGMVRSSKLDSWMHGKHDGIIDAETFEKAQALTEITATRCKRSQVVRNPLATFTFCGICGYTMHRRQNNGGIEYLTCHRCSNKAARISDIESALMSRLKEELKGFNYFLLNHSDEMAAKRSARDNEIEVLKKELSRRSQMLSKACEMLEQGIYSIDLFKARTDATKAAISQIEARISELESMTIDDDAAVRYAIPIIENVLEIYDTLNAEDKNAILKTIIKRIDYTNIDGNFTLDVVLMV